MIIRRLLVCLPFVVSLYSLNALAAPKGAKPLPSDYISVQTDGVVCGFLSSRWVPGQLLSNGAFYSHAANRSAVLKSYKTARGKKKANLQKQAKALQKLIQQQSASCSDLPKPSVTPSPDPSNPSVPFPTATPTTPGSGTNKVRFSFTGAVGLALSKPSTQFFGGNALMKVNAAGQLENATTSGNASVSKFLIAPNNKLYLLFQQKTALEDGATPCLLAFVDTSTGIPTCIEDEALMVSWLYTGYGAVNGAIQFDSTGAIYYVVTKMNGTMALRKWKEGTRTELINDNIWITDFVVLADSRVVLTGQTNSTNTSWVRRISAAGSLTNIHTAGRAMFLSLFPDDNVYFGTTATGSYSNYVRRYVSANDASDSRPWIASSYTDANAYNLTDDLCAWNMTDKPSGYCLWNGAYLRDYHRTTSGKMFVIAGGTSNDGNFMQYYPAVSRPTTVVKQATLLHGVIDYVFLAGLNADGNNMLTLFDSHDDSERVLIDKNNEIEAYHLSYSGSTNRLMFDGLRFSDNTYVIGQVDLSTLQVTASATGSTKLEDFQTF